MLDQRRRRRTTMYKCYKNVLASARRLLRAYRDSRMKEMNN